MKYTWCSMVLWLPLAGWAMAADKGMEGSLTQSVTYDDNFLFNQEAQDTLIYTLTPQLTGYYRTPTYTNSLTGALDIRRHSEFSDYDRSNPRINWQQSWLTQRSQTGLGLGYQQVDQRSEAADDLGDFTTQSRVSTLTVSPNYRYQWSERDSLTFSLNYTDRSYSGNTTSNDNTSSSVNTGWSHRLNPRIAFQSNLGYTRYTSEGPISSTESDILRLTAGGTYDWSERTRLSMQVGLNWQETIQSTNTLVSVFEDTSQNTGSVVTLEWSHRGLVNNYSASYSRDLSPSSDGAVREQDQLSLSFSRDLSERSRLGISGRWLQSSDEETSRDYFSLAPNYTYQFSRDLSLTARYDYKWQQRSNEDSIDGSVFVVNLAYKF